MAISQFRVRPQAAGRVNQAVQLGQRGAGQFALIIAGNMQSKAAFAPASMKKYPVAPASHMVEADGPQADVTLPRSGARVAGQPAPAAAIARSGGSVLDIAARRDFSPRNRTPAWCPANVQKPDDSRRLPPLTSCCTAHAASGVRLASGPRMADLHHLAQAVQGGRVGSMLRGDQVGPGVVINRIGAGHRALGVEIRIKDRLLPRSAPPSTSPRGNRVFAAHS